MSTFKPSAPWLLSSPALLVFLLMLLVPLGLTFILSFNVFDHATGIKNEYTLEHYIHVLSDEYYYGIFWRTLWISLVTTALCLLIGAPQAYILSRMKSPWKSIFLLIILAPLLVSLTGLGTLRQAPQLPWRLPCVWHSFRLWNSSWRTLPSLQISYQQRLGLIAMVPATAL